MNMRTCASRFLSLSGEKQGDRPGGELEGEVVFTRNFWRLPRGNKAS